MPHDRDARISGCRSVDDIAVYDWVLLRAKAVAPTEQSRHRRATGLVRAILCFLIFGGGLRRGRALKPERSLEILDRLAVAELASRIWFVNSPGCHAASVIGRVFCHSTRTRYSQSSGLSAS